MSKIYEIYYENSCGDIILCSDNIRDEFEATEEIRILSLEFPDNSYWYEVTYEDEQ